MIDSLFHPPTLACLIHSSSSRSFRSPENLRKRSANNNDDDDGAERESGSSGGGLSDLAIASTRSALADTSTYKPVAVALDPEILQQKGAPPRRETETERIKGGINGLPRREAIHSIPISRT